MQPLLTLLLQANNLSFLVSFQTVQKSMLESLNETIIVYAYSQTWYSRPAFCDLNIDLPMVTFASYLSDRTRPKAFHFASELRIMILATNQI